MDNKILLMALWYLKKGMSVIPIKTDNSKRPFISWEEFQERRASLSEIKAWWTKWPDANIGIITGAISGITVIDFDWYKMKDNERAVIEEKLPPLGTPTAITPRKGEHRYFKYCHKIPTRNSIIPNIDVKNDGGYIIAPPSTNGNGKYFWVKNKNPDFMTFRTMPPLYSNYLLYSNGVVRKATGTTDDDIDDIGFSEGLRDQTLFHLANYLVRGGMSDISIEKYLQFFARHCDPPFPEKEANEKIKSALKRQNKQNLNLTEEIRELIRTTSGVISTTDVRHMTTRTTRQEGKTIAKILQRLEREGLLERTERKAGEYRIVKRDYQVVNLNDVEMIEGVNIRLPFFLEHYVEILPKDLIVFAGEPNSGKTAIMLDVARMNMRTHACWYFSTEMGRHNAKKRIMKHDTEMDWKLKFVEDAFNYYDLIQPDELNFIDYLELPEGKDPWHMAQLLAGIQRRLKKGIAIIAMQKLKDARHAFGGQQTTAKPALFCSLEPDHPGAKMRIIKAKNFKDLNPNDWVHRFKIIKGINILSQGTWEPE